MSFPVIARKCPVRLKKFPVPSSREFAKIIEQCQHVIGKFEVRQSCFCKSSLFFPCLAGKSAASAPETSSLKTACTASKSSISQRVPSGRDLRAELAAVRRALRPDHRRRGPRERACQYHLRLQSGVERDRQTAGRVDDRPGRVSVPSSASSTGWHSRPVHRHRSPCRS